MSNNKCSKCGDVGFVLLTCPWCKGEDLLCESCGGSGNLECECGCQYEVREEELGGDET